MTDARIRLEGVLSEFGCQTGTLHKADGEFLELLGAIGVPDELLEKVRRIPFGKGIAGVAAEKKGAVELCNLQENLEGVAKEGARKSGVSGSIAVPIFEKGSEKVVGTLGIGKTEPYEFSEDEKRRLSEIAEGFAGEL